MSTYQDKDWLRQPCILQLLHGTPLRKPFWLENYHPKSNFSFNSHNRLGSRWSWVILFPNSYLLKSLSLLMWTFECGNTLPQSQWPWNYACQQKGMVAFCSPASLHHPGQEASLCTPQVLTFSHARVSLGGEYIVWGTVGTHVILSCKSPAFPWGAIYYPWCYCLRCENLPWEYSLLLKSLRIFWIPYKRSLSVLNFRTSHGHKIYPDFIYNCGLN